MFRYLLLQVSIENEKTDTLNIPILEAQAQLCLPVLPKISTVSTLNLGCPKWDPKQCQQCHGARKLLKASWVSEKQAAPEKPHCRDRGHDLGQLQSVKDSGLASCIQAQHQDSHFLRSDHARPDLAEE